MRIREIKIGELPGFVKSEEYEKLRTKPITPLRAHSQYKNPHADAEETALVFAAENDTLYAFAGIFPHKTFWNKNLSIQIRAGGQTRNSAGNGQYLYF